MTASVLLAAWALPALAIAAESAPAADPPQPITVFFRFSSAVHPQTMFHLRAELDRLFRAVPLRFEWLRIEEAPESGVLGEAIVVRFRGNCASGSLPALPDERGPFAWATVTDGVVLPFAEVNCDRVRAAVQLALWGGERNHANRHLGVALGRVTAHEVYHIYFRTRSHESSGVMRHALSPQDLVAPSAELHPEDRTPRPSPAGRD